MKPRPAFMRGRVLMRIIEERNLLAEADCSSVKAFSDCSAWSTLTLTRFKAAEMSLGRE